LKPFFWFNQFDDDSYIEDVMASVGMNEEQVNFYQPFMVKMFQDAIHSFTEIDDYPIRLMRMM